MIVTSASGLPDISIDEKYRTAKSVKYNVNVLDKTILYVSPDFTGVESTRGILCTKYNNGSIGIALNDDRSFILLLEEVQSRVNAILKQSKMPLVSSDKGIISNWTDKNGVVRSYVWCDIIRKSDGSVVYTKSYNALGEDFDITKLDSKAYVRPCLCFRLSYSVKNLCFRLRASVSEVCVIKVLGEKKLSMLPS